MDFSSDIGARSSSESSMVSSTFGESTTADFNDDTEFLIRAAEQKPPSRLNFILNYLNLLWLIYVFYQQNVGTIKTTFKLSSTADS